MEVAAYLIETARSVSVLVRGKVPFQNIFGLKIGTMLKKVIFKNLSIINLSLKKHISYCFLILSPLPINVVKAGVN